MRSTSRAPAWCALLAQLLTPEIAQRGIRRAGGWRAGPVRLVALAQHLHHPPPAVANSLRLSLRFSLPPLLLRLCLSLSTACPARAPPGCRSERRQGHQQATFSSTRCSARRPRRCCRAHACQLPTASCLLPAPARPPRCSRTSTPRVPCLIGSSGKEDLACARLAGAHGAPGVHTPQDEEVGYLLINPAATAPWAAWYAVVWQSDAGGSGLRLGLRL